MEHRFITYTDQKPLTSEASRLAAYILNRYTQADLSVTKYRRLRRLVGTLTDQRTGASSELVVEFDALAHHIRECRTFRHEDFTLPPLECDWLDASLGMAKPDAPIATADWSNFMKIALALPFGDGFPLQPCIDREGVAFASFQEPIQRNITALHRRLVEESHLAVSLRSSWFSDLRMLLNECISLVDITLHQLYFFAQHRGAEFGWRFDSEALGPRHGTRLADKLRWVGLITGKHLDDAAAERRSLSVLKAVRNHFNHFDPPCLAYSVEDVVVWLNLVPDVGRLAWRIREKLAAQLSAGIVEIVTLPIARFVPRHPELPRVAQDKDVGYASTIWPTESAGASGSTDEG